ncbi:DNA-binding response OmpR family regulator [Crossiella equi]|uniref:DNA-binding response OmpR family regulator n=1 Tax=Crossiella equi TaxID=130796 RepID=A0ABS5AI14_9PSEU|nr:response regulator transcription factor [Crossiella equi]MBP2475922.1 DNA-binding response OmpR family regulator [Crossiella equi]
MPRVLLIEDDHAVREGLQLALRRQGYTVDAAATGELGLAALRVQAPDIVVLDLMLPGIDGFEVCRRIRAGGEIPIIMLTARSDDMDIVGGLEAGADDYVVKPVQPRVLDARIRAVLRRGASEQSTKEKHGALEIDRQALVVTKDGSPVGLTPTELRLLLELSGSPGQVFSRQQLLQAVWEHDYLGDSRLVDACVQRLRAKIEDRPASPAFVQTVRGFGYRFGPV